MMNKDEALKMAIYSFQKLMDAGFDNLTAEINVCKEALEQPTVAELNNEYLRDTNVIGLEQPAQENCAHIGMDKCPHAGICQYCKQPAWQGLTDDEIYKCQHPEYPDTMYFARAIEQALKEKNHGL